MEIIGAAELIHARLAEDGLELRCSVNASSDEDLFDKIYNTMDSEELAELSINFRLNTVLETAIWLHEMPAYGNAINSTAKPLFDAMRSELLAMIDQIDVLKFVECGDR